VLVLSAPVWAFTVAHLKSKALEDAVSLAQAGAWHAVSGRWGSVGGEVTSELSSFWAYATLFVGITVLVQVLLVAVYDVLLNVMWGRTLGKAVFSLAVIGPDRSLPGTRQSVLRAALTIVLPGTGWALILAGAVWLRVSLMLIGLVLVVLSAVECLLLRDSTCWHDRRTRTYVVLSSAPRPVYDAGRQALPQNHDTGQSAFPPVYDADQSGFPQMYGAGQQAFTQGGSLAPQDYQAPQTRQAVSGVQQRFQQVRDSAAAARAIEHGKRLGEKLKRRRHGRP